MPSWFRLGARIRGAATTIGLACLVATGVVVVLAPGLPDVVILALAFGGFALLVTGGVLTLWPGAPDLPPREVALPVRGRWTAMNSPGDKVPSHGTHGFGQTWGIDLVCDPGDGSRPGFGTGAGFRDPAAFPGFGAELYAPADGEVVDVWDDRRDHRTRSTWGAYAYMLLEAAVREVSGRRNILGNAVVLDLGDGAYAALAHLQRGSAAVRKGDRVRAGQLVGRCGNSGNSSEPHLHFQLMDHPNPAVAAGLPFRFAGAPALPRNDEVVEPPAREPAPAPS